MSDQPYATIRDAVLAAAQQADPTELDGRERGETSVVVTAAMLGVGDDLHHSATGIGLAAEDFLFHVAKAVGAEEMNHRARRFYQELARVAAEGLETCARYETAHQAQLEERRATNRINPKVDPDTLTLDTGDLLGKVVHDPAVHPDKPWLWSITDRRNSSDESGFAAHGVVYSERYASKDEAATALERAVADMAT